MIFDELMHRHDPPIPPVPATEETIVTRIAAAKEAADRASAALAGLAANPLAEAVAETGAGASLDPEHVRLVLGIVSVIERNGSASAGFLAGLGEPQRPVLAQQPPDGPSAPQGT